MKLTVNDRMHLDRIRRNWLRFAMRAGLCAAMICLAGMTGELTPAQGVSTTTVQGTVYLATGKATSGTLAVSWPAFTTAAGQLVAAGKTMVTIGADGFVSVNLAPNLGATPAGEYYTAIFYLSDGSVNTQYWVVPAAAQASLAQVQAQVMPAAQAVQAVTKAYVDQAVSQALTSQITTSGGNLTGPLYLSGDPTQPLQAADKHYVDSSFNGALPLTGGAATGPLTATKLGAAYQVDQFPGANFGAKLQTCLNGVDPTYGGTCDARNFTGTQSMGSNLTISTANTTVELPCATIATASQIIVTAGTRNVSLRGCALRGGSAADGSLGGTVFQYSGAGPMVQVGDPAYLADTPGFHLDNVDINTTGATSAAQGLAAYRTQEMDVESVYFLGNASQTAMTLDGTGNYTGGTFFDNAFNGFGTAVNAIGHQMANAATTDWMNASTFVRLHIVCPTSGGYPVAGTIGVNLQQGDGNTFTGGDVEGCATALHLGPKAQNNTILGLRNENSTSQVVADAGSSYNNWITGGTMFTGKLADSGTRNSFLDTFHRSFNGMNGDWYGSQQDATVTNHYRLGTGTGSERGLQNRYQTDYGYRWTTGLSDATSGEQFYQITDELNNVNRISVGQYLTASANSVTNVVMNNGGCYSSNTAPAVSFAGGGGSGAAGTANMVASSCSGGWTVGSVTMTNKGSGYTSQPAITWSGGDQISAPNALAEISAAGSTNNQTVLNSAGTGAVVLNGSNNAGTGGVVFGSGGPSETTVATINNAGNAQFNGTLQVSGTSTFIGSTTVKNQADAEIDSILQAGVTASQKESLIYRDFNGASQWYMVKDQNNNWALNSATGNLDSFKAYQSTNSGDTYINAAKSSGVVRVNYETGAGTAFNIYGGGSTNLYASFGAANAIKFPGLAASSGSNCLQIDNSGYMSNTGSPCGSGSGGGSGTVGSGTLGQIAYYTANGTTLGGMSAVPVSAGGTGATTAAAALSGLVPGASTDQNGNLAVNSATETNSVEVKAAAYGAKNDNATDIGPALQSAFNAAVPYGTIVLNCKTPGCYWANPTTFNWGSKSVTLELEGTLRLGTTLQLPSGIAENIVGINGAGFPQFAGPATWASINGVTTTGTLGTDISTPDGTASTVTFRPSTMAGLYAGTMITVAENATCNISTVSVSNNLVTATFSSACDIPPGVPVTVTGVANAVFNGSHTNGNIHGPYLSDNADDVLNTLTWQAPVVSMGAVTVTSGSCNITVTSGSYASITNGMAVTGSGIPSGDIVASGGGTANLVIAPSCATSTGSPALTFNVPDGSSTGGTVTGLAEDKVEDVPITSCNAGAGTCTATFYRSHSAAAQWGIVGVFANSNTAGDLLKNISVSGSGTAIVEGGYIGRLENVGASETNACSGQLTNFTLSLWSTFTHIGQGSVFDAFCQPYSIHGFNYANVGYGATGPVYIDGIQTLRGIKFDHGAGSIYIKNMTCNQCGRAAFTFDPTNYWDGNQMVVEEQGIEFNDNTDQFPNYDYYQTVPVGVSGASMCPVINISGNYGSRVNSNPWACAMKTNTPTYYGEANQPSPGIVGTFDNGRQIDGEVRGEQAGFSPAIIPYATLNVPITPSSWTGGCTLTSTGILGPDGTTSYAGALISSSGGCTTNIATLTIGTPAVGDVVLFGAWDYTPTQGVAAGGSGFVGAVDLTNNSSTHFNFDYNTTTGFQAVNTDDPEIIGDWWHPSSHMAIVTRADGAASQSIVLRFHSDNSRTMEFALPWVMYIPASANIPLAEIRRWQKQLMHSFVPPNASNPASTLFLNPSYKISFGTQTNLYSGPSNSVKTDQAFDAVNGYKINGSYGPSGYFMQSTGSGTQWAPASGSVPAVPAWLLFQGDGSGGAFNCTTGNCGVTPGDYWYSSFNISAGATAYASLFGGSLNVPWVIHSTGTCTIAGTLSASPNGPGGGLTGVGVGGGGGGGGGGGTAAGSTGSATGYAAATGGTAGAASGGPGGIGSTTGNNYYQAFVSTGVFPGTPVNTQYGGAAGGNGGSSGGAGGKGGGVVILDCATINFTGTIDVSGASGGNAEANNTGAGGGGGGGFAILRSSNLTNSGTIKVSGGAGGSCGAYTGCGAGGAGASGWSKAFSQ